MKQFVRSTLVAIALTLVASVASASTILQFTEVFPFNTPFAFVNNGAGTTTLTASKLVNVTFDPSICLVVGCGGIGDGVFLMTLNAASTGAASLSAGTVSQDFGGTISFKQGALNLLTVVFSDTISGALGGSNPVLQSSQPPDIFSGTSDVFDALKLGIPRGLAISFSNLSGGGLGITSNSIRSALADGAGTVNATAVPEPASMVLLGSGLIMAARAARRKARQ